MSGPVLSGSSLSKSFTDGRGERVVLDSVDIEVQAGGVVGVKGPSGCGKTTLLNIVSGLLRPDAGSVRLAGEALDYSMPKEVARARRSHIGLVTQSYGLIDDESVFENIALPLRFGRSRPSRQARRASVEEAMGRAALDVDLKAKIARLSGGEKQRVAIARALVRKPSLLVADEPTAALDRVTASAIGALIYELAQSGVGILVATHDEVVAAMCHTVFEFNGPHLHASAPILAADRIGPANPLSSP